MYDFKKTLRAGGHQVLRQQAESKSDRKLFHKVFGSLIFSFLIAVSNAQATLSLHLPQASTVAPGVDAVTDFVYILSIFFTVTIPAVMIYFVVKYHRSRTGRQTVYITGHHGLEVIWTVVPLVLMLIIFYWGFQEYENMRRVSPDAIEVNVVGRQWLWQFQYTDGRQSLNDLVVPLNKPVKLIMTSEDVLHSFYVPNFRVKQDVVPGSYYYMQFTATQAGVHRIFCTEYCGTGHSDMLGNVFVLEDEAYAHWKKTGEIPTGLKALAATMGNVSGDISSATDKSPAAAGGDLSMAEQGRNLHKTKGCNACHSITGDKGVGPTWKGIYGTKEELQSGDSVLVDENYIRKSIMEPNFQIVKGFAPAMPTYQGQLSDKEINALIAFIKSLGKGE